MSLEVDWSRPWLAPYRDCGVRISRRLAMGRGVATALNEELAAMGQAGTPPIGWHAGPLRFVPQSALKPGQPYESFIDATAQVPTRDTLHDLFNGLVWLRFPRLKRRLNALQAEEIDHHGIGPTRGARRDALTLFDESGALWQAPAELVAALRQHDWQGLFVAHRSAWALAPFTLFGHALMEQLCMPRKGHTARVWCLPQGVEVQDHFVAAPPQDWAHSRLASPMPVLGVPGWWPGNDEAGFYDDLQVFRPARPPAAQGPL